MFRIVHLLVDIGEGELEGTIRLRDYLGYLLFFPNFLAGPIQRYEHLAPQLAAAPPPPTVQAFREGLARMLGGSFGAIVISDRKSVGSGKVVSVRVILGGRRILKK